MKKILPIILVLLVLSGCALNPVTGKKELVLVSESSEISIGAKQYGPSRQMQGGDYKTDPSIVAYVKQVGQKLASVSDRKLPYEFNIINDSTPNAWALPGGKIVINRGLLVELKSEAELAAVLGHEIVHAAARHGAKGMERGLLLQGAIMAVGIASQNSEYSQLAIGGAGMAAQLINQKYGRDAELEADAYGMRYMARAGYDPSAAIGLQETFVRLSAGRNQNWLEGLFASHPPSQERVAANRITATQLPQGGTIGEARYRKKMASLLSNRKAYEDYDAGRKALAKGDFPQAITLANQALKAQPREALFHSLLGDIRMRQQRYRDAITNYSHALQRDPNYFHYYLQRGLARLEINNQIQGKSDLEKSVSLLPTAPALNRLGLLFLDNGDRMKAKQYFLKASSSTSQAGKDARRAFIRLDLEETPHKYLRLNFGLDKGNYLLVQVTNTTEQVVDDVSFLIRFTDSGRHPRELQLMLSGPLGGKDKKLVATGIGPLPNLKTVQGKVVRATLAYR